MAVSPFGSALFDGSLDDARVSALFGDEATISAMLRVEAALARAQASLDVIPVEAADHIARTCEAWAPPAASLAAAAARDGTPVPALVDEFWRVYSVVNSEMEAAALSDVFRKSLKCD